MEITIDQIELQQTCGACPEQYDAFYEGKQVGYFRLRHGRFTVDYPDCMEERLITEHPVGDGIFEDFERQSYLNIGKQAICDKLNSLTPPK